MIKSEELSNPNSFLNRAAMDEYVFTVRDHDITYPATIRFWVSERIRLGKNNINDDQIKSALRDADIVENQRIIKTNPMITDDITCKGSYALGTACGTCSRCVDELEHIGALLCEGQITKDDIRAVNARRINPEGF